MRDLLAALAELRERLKEIPQADERRLSDLKTEILGRKAGALTQIIGRLPKLDPSSKKEVGAAANALKRDFEAAFEARERELKRAAGAVTGVDLTMPGRAGWQGGLHLITQPSTPRTRSIWAGTCCCVPIPRRCRSARSSGTHRLSAS